MIKKIQNDAGVRIQFKQGEGWAPPWPRQCLYPQLLQALSAFTDPPVSFWELYFS